MTFTTLTFGVFLVLVFALYWSLRGKRSQNLLILLASCVFYGWWDFRFLFLLVAASVIDYVLGILLEGDRPQAQRKWMLAFGLSCNLGMLFFFKYFNFFVDSAAVAAAALGMPFTKTELRIVLPVGISFYTFQTMTYSIDIYRRQLTATRDFVAYMAYVSFFPQLVAGPIERAGHLLPQFLNPRRFDEPAAREGLKLMLWGFMKKVLVADILAGVVNKAFEDPASRSGATMAFAAVCFAFQLYCDFSAYSDIACGSARLFGFELMRNFNKPYFAKSLPEFWHRWHISLSTWFRDYVYIPLGGNRRGARRQVFNLIVTFLLSGLWHGASWHFVMWGALHGLYMAASVPFAAPRDRRIEMRPDPHWLGGLKMLGTFVLVVLTLVFFRAQTVDDAAVAIWRIVAQGWKPGDLSAVLALNLKPALILAVFVAVEWLTRDSVHPLGVFGRLPRQFKWSCYTLCIWLVIYQGAHVRADFIYFQF